MIFFEVKEEYQSIGDTIWVLKQQQFNYYSKTKTDADMVKQMWCIRIMN
jgi:hypothetical protein